MEKIITSLFALLLITNVFCQNELGGPSVKSWNLKGKVKTVASLCYNAAKKGDSVITGEMLMNHFSLEGFTGNASFFETGICKEWIYSGGDS